MKCVAALVFFCVATAVADTKFGVVPSTKAGGDDDVKPGVVPVIQRTEVHDEVGQYALSYLTGDGTALTEQGALKPNAENDGHVLVKQGSVSYTSPEGIPISFKYVADENGFRPVGAHIPVSVAA